MISTKKHTYSVELSDMKPGDRLKVRSKEWYDGIRSSQGGTLWPRDPSGEDLQYSFTTEMSKLCGKEVTLVEIYKSVYGPGAARIREDLGFFSLSGWMFEIQEQKT